MSRKRAGAAGLCVAAAAAALALVGLVALGTPTALAPAYPARAAFAATPAEDDPLTVVRSQTYWESAGAQSVEWPQETQDDTGLWQLVEVHDPVVDPDWERPHETRQASKSVTVASSEARGAADSFEQSVEFHEGGFSGTLERAEVTSSPCYEVRTRQVDRLVTLPQLPANDVAQLPQTMDFEVTTAETLDSTGTKALALSDVSWSVSSADELGVPTSYTALCNYRGTEDYLVIPSYEVSCTWSGEVFQDDTQMLSNATYALVEPFPWWMVAAGMGLVGAGAAAVAAGFAAKKGLFSFAWPVLGKARKEEAA